MNDGIRITAAVALLLAVMSSPIRPPGPSHASPRPNYLPRVFALVESGYCGQFVISPRSSMREADADVEDGPTVASPPASVAFDAPPSDRPKRRFEHTGFACAAARPLRC